MFYCLVSHRFVVGIPVKVRDRTLRRNAKSQN